MFRPISLIFIFSFVFHFVGTTQESTKKINISSVKDLQNSWGLTINKPEGESIFNQFESVTQYPKKDIRGTENAIIQLDSAISNWRNHYYSYYPNGGIKSIITQYPLNLAQPEEQQYFDSIGQLTLILNIDNLPTNGFYNVISLDYTLDSLGNKIYESVTQKENGIWKNIQKQTWGYNNTNNLFTISYYQGDGNNWIEVAKYVLTYDSNNLLIKRLRYNLDSSSLSLSERVEYTYAPNGLSDTATYYVYDSLWILNAKYIKTYDNNANTLSSIYINWDNNQWVPFFKISNIYNIDDRETSSITQIWDSTYLKNLKKIETSYDQFGNKNLIIFYDGDSTSWINNEKYEYFYDINNNYQQEYWYKWNTNQWGKVIGYNCVIDSSVSISQINFPSSTWGPPPNSVNLFYNKFENKLIIRYSLQPDNNNGWLKVDSNIYYYSNIVTGINEVSQSALLLYPNPTTKTLNISGFEEEFSSITIFDLSGKQLKYFNISSTNNQVDIGDLKPGIYLVRLISGKKTITKRIVKL